MFEPYLFKMTDQSLSDLGLNFAVVPAVYLLAERARSPAATPNEDQDKNPGETKETRF